MNGDIQLGDMVVLGSMPAKLLKALAVIADTLHPAFALQPWIADADKSKESCVLCSLTVHEFLIGLGFADALVRPVVTIMRATRNGQEVHSLGIGVPGVPHDDGRWNGHAVVCIPSASALFDTTLYGANRPQWPDLPGMLAMNTTGYTRRDKVWGLDVVVGAEIRDRTDPDYLYQLVYLDNPKNNAWRSGPDARDRWKRAAVVAALRERFGTWTE
jgi:hypothetical protein